MLDNYCNALRFFKYIYIYIKIMIITCTSSVSISLASLFMGKNGVPR